MLKNYLKIAYRNLRRQKGYASINVFGLAVGLGVCLTLALYVRHEVQYDRFLPNAERVYRLVRESGTHSGFNVAMPPGLAEELRAQAPAFEHVTDVSRPARTPITVGQDALFLDNVVTTDAAFFNVFPYPFLQGNPATALEGPGRIVLTTSTAEQLFGDADPMGRTLRVDHYGSFEDFTVTGVIADPPSYTHLRFNALRSLAPGEAWELDGLQWNYSDGAVYGALRPGAEAAAAEAQVVALERATNTQEWLQDQVIRLEAATDVHLFSDVAYGLGPRSDVRYLYLFGAIGLLILLIACINYMNLATARAALRAREVGVRKAVGAEERQVAAQFLVEAVLLSLLAAPIALALTSLAAPLVERFIDARITLGFAGAAGLFGMALAVGLLAGGYPALYLARLQPTSVLKGRLPGLRRGQVTLRRGLVVAQFAASLVLIVGALVVYAQLRLIQTVNLGFDEELVLTAPTDGLEESDYTAFKEALQARPGVAAVSSGMPLGLGYTYMTVGREEASGESWSLGIIDVDRDYFEAVGMPVEEGQAFTDAVSAPAVVVNRSAARLLGTGGTGVAAGQTLSSYRSSAGDGVSDDGGPEQSVVAGIVEDFHNATLHESKAEPFMFRLTEKPHRDLLIRLRPGNLTSALADVQATWTQFVPGRPLDVQFLDDRIAAQYRKETRLGQIVLVFAVLAVFVACLGLFGLAAFTAERRTKEIGIRKVLGASVGGIVVLLSKEFVVLVALALALAVAGPLGYLAMSRWLEDFAYRIEIGPGLFLMAGGLAILVALATVSYQAVKAALADPVKSLRHE